MFTSFAENETTGSFVGDIFAPCRRSRYVNFAILPTVPPNDAHAVKKLNKFMRVRIQAESCDTRAFAITRILPVACKTNYVCFTNLSTYGPST